MTVFAFQAGLFRATQSYYPFHFLVPSSGIPAHACCWYRQYQNDHQSDLPNQHQVHHQLNSPNQCVCWVQDNAIASLVKVMREAHAVERRTLFVVGSYHIGKERAFFGAARALGFKIWCHAAKKQVEQTCYLIMIKSNTCSNKS